jgi:hypothetical protein
MVRSLTKIHLVKFEDWEILEAVLVAILDREVLLESNQKIDHLHGRLLFMFSMANDIEI